jgi:hypothetical protein
VAFLLAGAAKLTGTPYDWVGIAEDDLDALHLDDMAAAVDRLWAWPTHGDLLPGHVVCSSSWAWLYAARSLAHPKVARLRATTPGDWWAYNNGELWRAA